MSTLRAAVIGVGYLGNFHAQKYLALPGVTLVGVADTDAERVAAVAAKCGVMGTTDYRELLAKVDLVSIVTPPATHFAIAHAALEAGVHVLVEKPVTEHVAEAEALIALAQARRLVFQVGHLERFNPAVLALRPLVTAPIHIEARRMARYKERGTEVDVVLDMMIHDIDIVLSLVDSPLVSIEATGRAVVTDSIDIADVTLRFASGCVAELAASRVHLETVRAMKVLQPDSWLAIDFANHALLSGARQADGEPAAARDVPLHTQNLVRSDALMDEISSFVDAVGRGHDPAVTGEDGKRALEVAVAIAQRINRQASSLARAGTGH